MNKRDEFSEYGNNAEKDLLDFKFDDLPFDNGSRPGEPDDVIELVDVVERGELLDEIEIDDIAISLDEEDLIDNKFQEKELAKELAEEDLDFDLNDTDLESRAEEETEEYPEIEVEFEGADITEALVENEQIAKDLHKEGVLTESALDVALDEFVKPPGLVEKRYEEKTAQSEFSDFETQECAGLEQKATVGVSEERIEAIIREVVEDVVERVARETMVSVAERVIGQAIETLKSSIEAHDKGD
ncbi:hypothetical protein PITCH_A1510010 [uncultured Desulfobacterium sp.]|uniref:Uncharacterized protein n=1 Tax=uncultured Desulfobacterium sp. TaxID=201089 RepID=A0A445MTM8_9BACT|nr:hypothetical protein PITCH_A1510010 [uncultured Desulfobacterium sp.]